MMDPQVAARRDRRIRRLILTTLHAARTSPRGGFSARALIDTVNFVQGTDDQRMEDDDHALALLIDLRDAGYLEQIDQRTRKSQRYGIDVLFLKITAKGSQLIREEIPADPMVEDERIS